MILTVFAFLSLMASGAIFGFFYAWVCSTMWGLDNVDPRVAIAAMQAMNASVRNVVFAPAFFGTPFILIATAALAWKSHRPAGLVFAGAGLVYLCGGMLLTMFVNVPMNEALALVAVPQDVDAAAAIWGDYSPAWQFWNLFRTVVSGVALMLSGYGLLLLGRAMKPV